MNKKVDLGKISITLHNLEWNSTTVFEELTITPYEGESYISLTATQGNNPKTSPNFWMKVSARGESIYDLMVRTGKFDGTLEEFIQEYDDAVKNAETATSEVRALESEVRTSENTRIQNESTRVLNELTRISHENTRENNELTRKNNEITRLDKEGARERREQIRIDNENTRVSNESIRENHETLRKLNETTRLSAEQDRITNENTRIEREVTRVRNENTRNSQEEVRQSNETDRQSAEDLRKENETTRQENESDRNAERQAWNGVLNQKILDINTLISDVNSSEQTRLSNETTRQENEEERIQLMSTWGTEWTLKVLDIENYLETAYTKDQVDDLLDTKQDNLTFDTAPTLNSNNPVTSNGIKVELNKKLESSDLNTYINGGLYNSSTKKIELLHGQTIIAQIDATAFIKDGMVSNVLVINGNIVITFNTDSGKEAISIPTSDIFNPNNYYNKTEVENLVETEETRATAAENEITEVLNSKDEQILILARLIVLQQQSIEGLKLMLRTNLGDIKVSSIDSEYMPQVVGEDLIIVGTSAPTITPKFIGQIYVNTGTSPSTFMVAKSVTNSIDDWK